MAACLQQKKAALEVQASLAALEGSSRPWQAHHRGGLSGGQASSCRKEQMPNRDGTLCRACELCMLLAGSLALQPADINLIPKVRVLDMHCRLRHACQGRKTSPERNCLF